MGHTHELRSGDYTGDVLRKAADELVSKLPVHPTDGACDEVLQLQLVEALVSRAQGP